MANARRERAPKTAAVRLRTGRAGLRRGGLAAIDARSAFGRLTRGGRVVCLSKGAVSFADAVRYLLEVAGAADVTLTTWAIGARELTAFRGLVDSGAIRSLRLLVDASFVNRQPAYTAKLRALFGPDCVRLANSHAKLATVVTARRAFVLLSSANLNDNRRLEVFQIEDNRRLAHAINRTLDAWFRQPAGDQWDVSRTEHNRRFEAWGARRADTPAAPASLGAPAAIGAPADGEPAGAVDAPAGLLAPATAADGAFFSSDPWGVDLRRAGMSFLR